MVKPVVLTGIAALTLAACGEATPRAPAAGQQSRAAVDAATAAYSDCVTAATRRLAVPTIQASDAADAGFHACLPARAALVAKVLAFRRLGMPSEPATTAASVAEASVGVVETDLRADAVVAAIEAQVAHDPNKGDAAHADVGGDAASDAPAPPST